MKVDGKRVLLCSCEKSMPIDPGRLAAAFGQEEATLYDRLCLNQVEAFRHAQTAGEQLMVCCAQEAPLFSEIAEQEGRPLPVFVDIRDRAGWSDEASGALPKMAALIAEAALDIAPTPAIALQSEGVTLVCASDEVGLAAAGRLAADRAVTCLLVPPADHLQPPPVRRFALFRGRIGQAKGALGSFELKVSGLTVAAPSSRQTLTFTLPIDTEVLTADVVLDLTGGPPLFAEGSRRDGYVRADPRSVAEVERALAEVQGLVGEFDKPRYVKVDPAKCAHSRNGIVGCTRCLDACPTSSILSLADAVQVDPHACSGHGACSAVCPTGAITYDLPAANSLFARLTTLLDTFHRAGGRQPQLLLHDLKRGAEIVSGLATFERGLPASVIPFGINEVTAIGLDFLLTALAHGAQRLFVLVSRQQHGELTALHAAADLVDRIVGGLGQAGGRVVVIDETDPAQFAEILRQPAPPPVASAATYRVLGGRRETIALALQHLAAQGAADTFSLPAGAPFGRVVLDAEKCTLCHACVGACPTSALGSHPDKPLLSFLESACVQCSLCRLTCPERAITLEPRLVLGRSWNERQVLKEEEPFTCVRCGKAFGTRSSIERIASRLVGHPMFADASRLNLIRMCEDCRVIAQIEQAEPLPLAGRAPSKPRTTEDYLKERDETGDGRS